MNPNQLLPNDPTRTRFSNPWYRVDRQIFDKGYKLFITTDSKFVLDNITPFRRFSVTQKIQSLASLPRPQQAGHKKGATDVYRLRVAGFFVDYKVMNGEVTVEDIVPDPSDEHNEKPGLYLVKRDTTSASEWKTEVLTENITTEHAAVNGMQNDLKKAQRLMGLHIEHAFSRNEVKEFTLFHNPTEGFMSDLYESTQDKFGFTTEVTKKFAMAIQTTQQHKKEVSWVAHSQGGLIFTQAVHYHNSTKGTLLDKHSIQFNGHANNKLVTNRILDKAKVKILGYNNNPVDIVPQIIGLNALDSVTGPVKLLASVIPFSLFVAFGGPNSSPHTRPYKGSFSRYLKEMFYE